MSTLVNEQASKTDAATPMSLVITNLHYDPARLHNIHLKIAQGERIALLGANGSGKSSLLKIIHGLQHPTSGAVRKHHTPDQEAMVFQRPLLLRASVRQNLHLALAHRAANRQDAARTINEALVQAQLTGKEHQIAQRLSGGEQQRLCLTRALMMGPHLLLLDEPTANIDPGSLQSIEQLIGAASLKGQTLILATHSFAQARRLCKRVVMLQDGQIIADQSVDEFFNTPANSLVQKFIDSERF